MVEEGVEGGGGGRRRGWREEEGGGEAHFVVTRCFALCVPVCGPVSHADLFFFLLLLSPPALPRSRAPAHPRSRAPVRPTYPPPKGVSKDRPYDAKCGPATVKILGLLVLLGGAGFGIFVWGPTGLKHLGAIDIPDDPHDILGVPYGFNKSQLKKAYKEAALKWHPDKNPDCGKKCDDMTSKINEAYRLLKDPAMFSDHRQNEWIVVWEAFQKWIEKKGSDDDAAGDGGTKKKKKKKKKRGFTVDDEL